MDGFDRVYDLHRVLKGRKTVISTKDILCELECSRATFNRVKRHMIDFLGAPIEYDRNRGGYYYVENAEEGFELPGVWFNEKELNALLLVQQLLTNLGVGVLKEEVYPIQQRVAQLLRQSTIEPASLSNKVHFLGVGIRDVEGHQFQSITHAILNMTRIGITYVTRDEGIVTQREISPQKLINYRNNWFLYAWCHKREHYRTFAVECVSNIQLSSNPFKVVNEDDMENHFKQSYGIFAGSEIDTAIIKFKPGIAQRISEEVWHSKQQGHFSDDGFYTLKLPFNIRQPDELIMDIVKLGDKAEVVFPQILRDALVERLNNALGVYQI
ncbi:YafY family protein [Pleionea sp. CnH1-48]|uniref:helix-turn-helix transcriptional regulator n=1 Tax=Pleionea sp. CnH1-48 TaxID=2954494 RepID=UPI002096DC1C|nr:WYL domain-containing protein [Pleionea sp. CnH1-48]MCO7223650.1 WYL domain-containing protein [Pleionea sp. CnH1-48]